MSSSKEKYCLNDLLEELKLNKVEIKTAEEIFIKHLHGDKRVNRSFENNGEYPCVTCTDIFESRIYIDEYKTFVDVDTVEKKTYIEWGDILVATDGYSTKRDKDGFCVYLSDNKPLAGSHMYVLKHNQNPKYLAFALNSNEVKKQLKLLFTQGLSTILRIFIRDIKKINVPVPSLELQEKIGDFLFSFVEYDKQLKREQKARSKQFHFYKEQIFSELVEKCRLRNVGWEIKSIGDFATEIYSGNEITKEQLGSGDFPAIKYIGKSTPMVIKDTDFVDINLIKKPKYCEEGDILFCKFNQNKEIVGKASLYLKNEKCLVGGAVVNLKHLQNPKYLSYVLSTQFVRDQIESMAQNSTVFHLYTKDIKKLEIPLPPLEEQERIVEILDKFYDLSENPDKGLNKLIKLNQKQYEYYRNLIFDQLKIEG